MSPRSREPREPRERPLTRNARIDKGIAALNHPIILNAFR
jgi:hypothetical protein